MAESKPRRKLAAILAADVVGFSKKMGENEERTLSNLKSCRSITDESIENHHGRVFGSAGDSIIAEFASPVDAILSAVEFQKNLRDRNLELDSADLMEFRVGLNLGDVIVEGENLYGDGVNVAARLEPLADPGGICISEKFHEEVRRKLDLSFVSLGEREMKNIEEPVTTFMVELGSVSNVLESISTSQEITETNLPADPVDESDLKPEARVPAIAVLPFSNMGGDPEQEYFADGITEDIITNLSLWRTFPVISRNSSFTYRGKSQNLKQVAHELGARYIVEGSVRKGGNRLRITAQLIDAQEDHHLWSEKWDRTMDDIFDVQDEVSEAIARRVAPSVTGYEQNRLIRKRPKSLSAWEEYLQGLRCINERQRIDHEDPMLSMARSHFERSVYLDPTLSDAHAYLSLCGAWELVQRITKDSEQTLDGMLADGRRAEALNPENPLALTSIATAYFFRGDHDSARDYGQRAVKLNPSFALSYFRQGMAQVHSGDYQQGERAILKTFELSPADPDLSLFYTALFFAYLGQGKYEKAYEAVEKASHRHPGQGHLLGFRAAVLGHLGKTLDAKAALERYIVMRPNLKTRNNYRSIFVPNSSLADIIIEGLIKAGWEPEE